MTLIKRRRSKKYHEELPTGQELSILAKQCFLIQLPGNLTLIINNDKSIMIKLTEYQVSETMRK